MDKNSILHPKSFFEVVLCLFWKLILIILWRHHFFVCFSLYEMLHICNTYYLTTDVANIWLLQNVFKNCVTVHKTSSLWCSTPKLFEKKLFCGKMHKYTMQLIHATLSYYQNKANSHPQITNIKLTLIYIFPHSAFPDFNPQQPLCKYPNSTSHLISRTIKYLQVTKWKLILHSVGHRSMLSLLVKIP